MKNTHVSRSGGGHARYDAEYKREALKLWRSSGRSAAKVAAELGIRAPLLYRWARAEREPIVTKNASGNATAQPSVAALQAEVERLRGQSRWGHGLRACCPNRARD